MVLESLIDPWSAKKHPIWLFVIGMLFSSIALVFGLWVFRSQASLIMVFLTVIMSVPLMYATLVMEEEQDLKNQSERTILVEHGKAIRFLTILFLGFVLGFSLWYIFMPASTVQTTFNVQLETINAINSNFNYIEGNAINWAGASNAFYSILTNNLKVFMFCLLFSFFFGAGAIFILAWNASVISAAVGTYFRNTLATYSGILGFSKVAIYFQLLAISLMRYLVHGVFEIVAYFLGGLAGGIISVALLKHGAGTKEFNSVLYDALFIMMIALVLILVGTIIEVFITPLIF